MVEYTLNLDEVFGCLADPTRRDILERVTEAELTVSEIALPYDVSLAAVSKHLKILERAKLILRRKQGKHQYVQADPTALKQAQEYLDQYAQMLTERYDGLEIYINKEA
jgi:DNA-binding transcriptional ArsR family regulator